jgi:tetratricopeptide (TPR) repeat protein
MMGDAFAKKDDHAEAFQAYLKSKEIYERQGHSSKLASIDKKIAKLSPDKMDPQQRRFFLSISKTQEADQLAAEGRLEEAVAFYQQLIATEPINFSYREKLANLFLENAQVTEASAQLKAVADIHLAEGRLDAAQVYAGKISLMDPEGLESLGLLAALAEKKGDSSEAMKLRARLAQKEYELGSFEQAKASLEKAGPLTGDLKLLMAKTLVHLKKTVEAKQQFEDLFKENPQDDGLLEQLLSLAEETKDWNGAHSHLEELLKRHPEDPKLQPRLARILLQVGKRAEALQIYVHLAGESLKENKMDAALGYFDNVLALEPENTDLLKKKAEIYLKLGKKQEVIESYKKIQVIFTQKKMLDEAKKAGLILAKLAGLK